MEASADLLLRTDEGTLLIGADGAHGNVRHQYIPGHRIVPTGGFCVYGKTPLREDFSKGLEPAVFRGMGAIKDRIRILYPVTVMELVVFTRRQGMIQHGFECPEDYLYWVLSGQNAALALKDNAPKTRDESAAVAEKIA